MKRKSSTFEQPRSPCALHVEQTAYVCVYANRLWNDTGVDVVSGQAFNFSVPSGEVWTHWSRECSPDGHLSSRFSRHWETLRRIPKAVWCQLVGTIGKSTRHPTIIGSKLIDFLPAAQGRLYLFANDLPWMYWNNRGMIAVRITRTK